MTPIEAYNELRHGNERFVSGKPLHPRHDPIRRGELVGGQKPFAAVLSCADSRVVPELIFDQGLGDLFVVRVAGNVANSSSVASIEYAVANLGTQLVVVLGHQSCGAVTAAVQGGEYGPHLNHLLGHIAPALQGAGTTDVESVIRSNAKLTAHELLNSSEILQGIDDVLIIPGYYSLSTGEVQFLGDPPVE